MVLPTDAILLPTDKLLPTDVILLPTDKLLPTDMVLPWCYPLT